MRAGQVGQWQIQQTSFILVDQPFSFNTHMPMLSMHQQWRANFCGLALDDLKRFVLLWPHDGGDAAF